MCYCDYFSMNYQQLDPSKTTAFSDCNTRGFLLKQTKESTICTFYSFGLHFAFGCGYPPPRLSSFHKKRRISEYRIGWLLASLLHSALSHCTVLPDVVIPQKFCAPPTSTSNRRHTFHSKDSY